MPKSSQKPSKKGGKSGASKSLAQEIENGHSGDFNPNEGTVQSSSAGSHRAGNEDSHDPNATRTHKTYSSSDKASETDPGGHSGDFDPNMTEDRQSNEIPLEDLEGRTSTKASGAGRSEDRRDFYHRDLFRRPFKGKNSNDKFLNPYDGRLCDLVVQGSKEVLESNSGARWFRKGLKNGSSWIYRLSNWAMSRDHGSKDTVGTDVGTDVGVAIIRWIPACLALAVVVSLPIQVAGTPSNFGKYDAFLYKDWRYPLEARNKSENKHDPNFKNQQTEKQPVRGLMKRRVEPKYLCFIGANDKVEVSKVSDWTGKNGQNTDTSYVFVSFTTKQFKSTPDNPDNRYLRGVGKHAAKAIGVNAYWISTSCLYDLNEKDKQKIEREKEETVWTMSDVIRRARAVAIAVPGPIDAQYNGNGFREWGDRAWTMPELLLYTGDHPIFVYEKVKPLNERRSLPRRELWSKVWSDSDHSGQLIDHYEKSLTLSPLELVTVALQCLYKRYKGEYLPGDMSYILMGLLRHRPTVVSSDSAFQAFARLSLANDSNMLLERLICLLPKRLDENWWSLDDAWNARLWDIYPKIQICGLGDDDTVILDGARGAAIRWGEFVPVVTLLQETTRHQLSRWIIRTMPVLFWFGIFFIGFSSASDINTQNQEQDPFLAVGIVLLVFSSVIVFLLPYLIRLIYRGNINDSQPFFFGFEGYVDIYQLELLVFGSYEARLHWSTASSPLSRHSLDREGMKADFIQDLDPQRQDIETLMEKENMYTGIDPVKKDNEVKDIVEKAKSSSERERKVFTLVDTYTMTVTLFEAVRPPVAVVLCGEEGGMQRALLCSEDWTSGTLYRETVMRMETRVWDRMNTMARIRLGLERKDSREVIDDPKRDRSQKAHWLKRLHRARW